MRGGHIVIQMETIKSASDWRPPQFEDIVEARKKMHALFDIGMDHGSLSKDG